MIAGLAAVGMVWALRPACGQSAWPNYPNNTAISVSTSAYVGIGTATPRTRLDINGWMVLGTVNPTYVYNNGWSDLWIDSEGASSSRIVLATGYNWDNQVIFQYTPGTLGAQGGILAIGQLYRQDQPTFTHGITALYTNGMERVRIAPSGNVGIGTTAPQYKLAVNGAIGAKEVIVTNTGWPDYVFRPGYRLRPLSEVGAFIRAHRHLPDLPSEAEVKEKGVSLGEMQARLLAKIEELTLHLIRQDQEHRDLRERLAQLETRAAVR